MAGKPQKKIEDVGKKYELDPIDHLLLKHLINFPNSTNEELGEVVGLSPHPVRRRRLKPAFVKAYRELTASTREHLAEAARRAAIRLKKLIEDDDKDIALQAMKMALANHLRTQVDVNVQPRLVYKTTIGLDGALLQEVIEEEIQKTFLNPTAQVIDAEAEPRELTL